MNSMKFAPATAAIVLSLAAAAPAMAQGAAEPWAQIQTTSAMVGLGGQSGDGQLSMPNLGTNCVYPFKVSGFGAGIQVGISRASAAGAVKNLTALEEFSGNYSASQGEATVIAGGGGTTMKNNANNVSLTLASQTTGLNIGIAGQGFCGLLPLAAMGQDGPRMTEQRMAVLPGMSRPCRRPNLPPARRRFRPFTGPISSGRSRPSATLG
jgi:hypothetical protein